MPDLLVERNGPVMIVTMNRPARKNAMTLAMFGRMRDAWQEASGFIYEGLLKTARPTKPIIAAVEGVAIAGGTEILQGTDIRMAGESARFGVSDVRALPDRADRR